MKKRRYDEEERRFLKEHIPGRSYAQILSLFNARNDGHGEPLTESQLKSFIGNNHVNTGRTGRFPKGHEPYNKGKKGPQYGYLPTCFKKGQMPINHRPVGSTRINVDGYTEIKVAEPNKWRSHHVVIWEEANGAVPKGHCLIFGDGNKQNITLDNLLLITRAELAMLNKFNLIGASAELTKTGVLVADLKMKMYEKKKRN